MHDRSWNRTAQQNLPFGRFFERFGGVRDTTFDDPAFTVVADTRSTGPPYWNVARFSEFEQATKALIPPHRQSAARK
jgi:hypothetical protein